MNVKKDTWPDNETCKFPKASYTNGPSYKMDETPKPSKHQTLILNLLLVVAYCQDTISSFLDWNNTVWSKQRSRNETRKQADNRMSGWTMERGGRVGWMERDPLWSSARQYQNLSCTGAWERAERSNDIPGGGDRE